MNEKKTILSIYLGNDLVSTIPMPTEDQLVVIDPRLSISYVHYSMLNERASEPMKKLTDIFPPDQFTITHRNDQSILIECVQASDETKK